MKYLLRTLTVACLTLSIVGCGSDKVDEMAGDGPLPPWDALQTFQGEPMMSVGYPAERGAMGDAKKALTSPTFEQALTAFETSEIPSDYSEEKPAKEAAVKAWRDAIETAKSGSLDDLKGKIETAKTATSAMRARK